MKLGRLWVAVGSLDGNHHGPNRATLRSTWLCVDMSVNPGIKRGWRVYRYRADGSNRCLDVFWCRRPGWERRS